MKITIDYETHLFAPGNMAPKTVCLSWASDDDSGLLVGEDIPLFLEQLLDDDSVVIIGHNMSYDMMCSIQNYPYLNEKIWNAYDDLRIQCTYVREKLLDIAIGKKGPRPLYSLLKLAKKHFDIELDKDTWRTDYDKLDGVPLEEWPEGAKEYAITDSVVTHQLYGEQDKRAKKLLYEGFYDEAGRQACYALALHLTSARGVMIDQNQVDRLKQEIEPRMDEAIAMALEYNLFHPQSAKDVEKGKYRKNLKQVREVIAQTYPGEPPVTEKKGSIKTDAETIEKCDHPGLNAISDLNALTKTNSTYLEVYRKAKDKPLHCSYDVLGAATGRTSSWGTNIQNQPRMPGMRECFRARDGWVFVFCDYDSQEIRTLGQATKILLGRSTMAEAFKANPDFDPHVQFAGELLGLSYDEAMKRKRAGDKEVLEFRQRAKCFHPDTEVLTPFGWIRIEKLTRKDLVASAYPGRDGECVLTWENPIALTCRKSPGKLFHLKNENIDLRVTEDHRMLGFLQNGSPRVMKPADLDKARCWSNAGILEGGQPPIPDDSFLKLAVMTQADGSYSPSGIRFGFSKRRKIERCRSLLRPFKDWSESSRGKVVSFYIRKPLAKKIRSLLDTDKTFPWWWLRLPLRSRLLIIDEAKHWDGSIIRKAYSFSSTSKKSIEVMQALASISGKKACIRQPSPRSSEKHLLCYRLRISDKPYSRGGNLNCESIPYDGEVVCLSVPSSYVLVRDKGVVVITGQCSNFGFPGGLGATMFRKYARGYGVELSEDEAIELRDNWFKQWPEMREYFGFIENLTHMDGRVVQLQSGRIRGNCGYCDAANSFFQGLASDASKLALYYVTKECFSAPGESALSGCRPVVFIHDEIGIEAPEGYAHEAALRLEEVMVRAMEEVCPDVPSRATAALMRRWSKKAERVFGENGRLIPWEDKEKLDS